MTQTLSTLLSFDTLALAVIGLVLARETYGFAQRLRAKRAEAKADAALRQSMASQTAQPASPQAQPQEPRSWSAPRASVQRIAA